MTASKPNPVARLLPSLTDVAFLLPVAFLFLKLDGARTLLGDGDTGWHVRTGEWMLQNGRVPRTDMFSYTMPGRPWFAWEWLWDLCFGWLHSHFGMAAVVWASTLVLCLTFALLFRLVRRTCDNVLLAIGVTALAAAGSSIHWLARPHLLTLLFVVLFAWILEVAHTRKPRLVWLLPVLMVVWTNLHGGFVAGFLILGAYVAGDAIGWALEPDVMRRYTTLRRLGILLRVMAACLAATFVNPYFYHLHVHIYQYLRDPFLLRRNMEFQSFNFQEPVALYAEPMFLMAVLAAFWMLSRRRFGPAILILGWMHLALLSVRNLPLFLVIAAPPIAAVLAEMLQALKRARVPQWIPRTAARFESVAAEFGATDRIPRWHLASAAAVVLLALAFYTPTSSAKLRAEYDPARYPVKALATLRTPDIQRIFTHDQWGDYLIYNLYPLKKVFVDGRSDFYGTSFDEKFINVMRVKTGWEQSLSQYSVDTILLPVDESLAGALKQSPKWRVIYDDGVAIVFRSATPTDNRTTSVAQPRPAGAAKNDLGTTGVAASPDSNPTSTTLPDTRS